MNTKKCAWCGKELSKEKSRNKFCSRSCSASASNYKKPSKNLKRFGKDRKTTARTICEFCGKKIAPNRVNGKRKYCSRKCFFDSKRRKTDEHSIVVKDWLSGKISGTSRYSPKKFVRNYMMKLAGEKCQNCGWGERNKFTGKVPLQIHHINGDSRDNRFENLKVLCPNCHSLTENFGSRNRMCPDGKSRYYGTSKARSRSSEMDNAHLS